MGRFQGQVPLLDRVVLFSTHVCSAMLGSIGWESPCTDLRDRVPWFESGSISCTLFLTMSQPYSEKGKTCFI